MEFLVLLISLLTAYGIYRLVRRGTSGTKVATRRDSAVSHTIPPTSVLVPAKSESTHKASRSRKTPRWIEPGDTVTVAGRKIGGMIYLGPRPRRESRAQEGSPFIDPGLSVAKVGSDIPGDSMPYWPSYSDINPRTRATYLDWLASGRADKQYGVGYVFLYFYGLERRFFVDSPVEEESRLLVAETERLLSIYGENHSIRRYLGAFLDASQIVLEPVGPAEPLFEKSGYELPLGLRITIGRMAKGGLPLRIVSQIKFSCSEFYVAMLR